MWKTLRNNNHFVKPLVYIHKILKIGTSCHIKAYFSGMFLWERTGKWARHIQIFHTYFFCQNNISHRFLTRNSKNRNLFYLFNDFCKIEGDISRYRENNPIQTVFSKYNLNKGVCIRSLYLYT